MSQINIINILEIVGSPLCVSADDGQLVHDKIKPLLQSGKCIKVSFAGVTDIISAFLNAAIGQLYGEFTEERIRELLSVQDMTPDDMDLLRRVNDNALLYFKNKPDYDQAWKEEVGDEE